MIKFHNFNYLLTLLISFSCAGTSSAPVSTFLCTQAAKSCCSHNKAPETRSIECPKTTPAKLAWVTKGQELEKAQGVFVEAFLQAYKGKDIQVDAVRKATDVKQFLHDTFASEVDALEKQKDSVQCVLSEVDGKVVGFATFETTKNPGEVRIRQLAVDPAYKGKGIGKQLVFSVLEKIKDVNHITMQTRFFTGQTEAFYKALGFNVSELEVFPSILAARYTVENAVILPAKA